MDATFEKPGASNPGRAVVNNLRCRCNAPYETSASQYVNRRDDTRPLKITNSCPETIYPGIATQAGTLGNGGFELSSGSSQTLDVSADWQGRVWGRTNCSFNAQGTGAANNGYSGGGSACLTGDCNGVVNCKVTVRDHRLVGL
jgi:hypothetical protein